MDMVADMEVDMVADMVADIFFTFHQYVLSNESSMNFYEKTQSHIGCTCLTFLYCLPLLLESAHLALSFCLTYQKVASAASCVSSAKLKKIHGDGLIGF